MIAQQFKESKSVRAWGTLIFLSIIWGSSFILIKKALIAFSAVEVGLLRVFITFLAFLPVLILKYKLINWKKWKYFLAVGLLGSAIPSLLFATAQTQVSSSIAGVLNSITPVFTLFIGVVLFKEKTKLFQIIGVIFGLVGALFLLMGDAQSSVSGNLIYGSLIVLATFCYAYNVNAIKAWFTDTSPLIISAVSFSLLGPLAGIYLFYNGLIDHVTLHEYGYNSLISVIFLGVIGTALSTIIFFKLIQDTNPLFGSSVAFIIPIVAVFWGLIDGEQFYLFQIFGMALVLFGIYLIRKK